MSNLFANIDFGAFFGAEVRVLEGQECLFIPLRYNPSIRMINRRPTALVSISEMKRPDAEGNTHEIYPHIPRSLVPGIADADFVKMTRPIGRARLLGPPVPNPEPQQRPVLDHNTLAPRAVKDDDIPL